MAKSMGSGAKGPTPKGQGGSGSAPTQKPKMSKTPSKTNGTPGKAEGKNLRGHRVNPFPASGSSFNKVPGH